MDIWTAIKAAFDSLVRTYTPILASLILTWLASWTIVPQEVESFVYVLIAAAVNALWFGIIRVRELVRGKASVLLGLGIVKAQPVYVPDVKTDTDYEAGLNAADHDRGQGTSDRDRA